ncbi:Transcription factor tgal4 [Asimina triloba]
MIDSEIIDPVCLNTDGLDLLLSSSLSLTPLRFSQSCREKDQIKHQMQRLMTCNPSISRPMSVGRSGFMWNGTVYVGETETPQKSFFSGAANSKKKFSATLRRLAQNREAARKSRLRKKAYVQQLETSRLKLTQLEQDLQRARTQGLFLGGGGGAAGANASSGAAIFDVEYARWLEENQRHMSELRAGLQAHLSDGDLRFILDGCLSHYDEIFRLKGAAAKADVFHLMTGMWTTPAERCFLWMGGFRPSELLKVCDYGTHPEAFADLFSRFGPCGQILIPQLDPLTDQQIMGICTLQQSSQQAEEALSQGLEQLQHSLADTISGGSLSEGTNVADYMGHMAIALGKLSNLEGFVRQGQLRNFKKLAPGSSAVHVSSVKGPSPQPDNFPILVRHTLHPQSFPV